MGDETIVKSTFNWFKSVSIVIGLFIASAIALPFIILFAFTKTALML